jgi:ubiquinone/menaquinone biosynthesis C-methylase UbiE
MSIPSYKTGWNKIDEMSDPGQWVRFMDRINQEDLGESFLDDKLTIEWLDIKEGNQVLEVGCGTGGMARGLALLAGVSGHVVGIDLSETMLAEARRRSVSVPTVEFLNVDVHRLPFADNSFDRCYSRLVFEVVDDPRQALSEMVRVLRPGGIIVIPAPDYGSLAIDSSDRALTRTILNYICDVESNGWIGRQLPYMFVSAGLTDLLIDVQARVSNDFQYFFEHWLGAAIGRAVQAGVVTEAQARGWITEQHEHYLKNVFFEVNTAFTVRGVKPEPGNTDGAAR